MELTLKNPTKLATSTFKILLKAHRASQENRLEEFLKYVELRYEYISIAEQSKLNEYIHSHVGQEVLAKFADSILHTSSRRVRMAIALIYCQDSDFDFEKSEKITFISAMKEMNDDLLDFFLLASELETQKENIPYPRAGIHHNNHGVFKGHGWDEEAIFVYINDLVRLRLLLPDPKSFSSVAGNNEGWAVWFGITNRTLKMAALLRKAESLLVET
ncbi:hypothetical protein [Shewanella sp. GutDb-MelDb]|uniref:hypothetical protein n=1 Tax=Shewanella sp. GutDb-MelDb TaxID=2058316 RepID=UPI000C79F603|nr:hypothetical protein [Shewanella sp. GutDb-MelDb]PKG59075.1 hypothetical protein CXF82_01185 [Shewanella sp. GutDb-MelDb]